MKRRWKAPLSKFSPDMIKKIHIHFVCVYCMMYEICWKFGTTEWKKKRISITMLLIFWEYFNNKGYMECKWFSKRLGFCFKTWESPDKLDSRKSNSSHKNERKIKGNISKLHKMKITPLRYQCTAVLIFPKLLFI